MIKAGKKAPGFALASSDGTTVGLADFAGKTLVVYFYPRDNTPGCTIEAQEFRDAVPALKKLGAAVVGVSKDSIASHCKFRDKYQLSFPLLSDPDGKMLEAYDAWGEKSMYGKKMMGIIRSTVVIDGNGVVIKHFAKVSIKGHVDAVLAVVKDPSNASASDGTAAPAPKAKPAALTAAKPAKKVASKTAAKTAGKTAVKSKRAT
ncbi:MAG: thioredoxin-dependent thiol peroxidase [Kofleriaceae bacterium]|nr:thioredoxin-dependent thiol peroxidase [Kofleriaceae bacterium]